MFLEKYKLSSESKRLDKELNKLNIARRIREDYNFIEIETNSSLIKRAYIKMLNPKKYLLPYVNTTAYVKNINEVYTNKKDCILIKRKDIL